MTIKKWKTEKDWFNIYKVFRWKFSEGAFLHLSLMPSPFHWRDPWPVGPGSTEPAEPYKIHRCSSNWFSIFQRATSLKVDSSSVRNKDREIYWVITRQQSFWGIAQSSERGTWISDLGTENVFCLHLQGLATLQKFFLVIKKHEKFYAL